MLLLFLWMACTTAPPPCGTGWVSDPARHARLAALVGHPVEAQLCFGDVPERGLRDTTGRFLLDRDTDDLLLAARIVHLEQHTAQPEPGPACVDTLRDEEARGWAAELAHRHALGIDDPTCPLQAAVGPSPTLSEARRWLNTSADPVAAELRESHRHRCGAIR